MNGNEEKTIAVGGGIPPGLHSPQSSPSGSMGRWTKRSGSL